MKYIASFVSAKTSFLFFLLHFHMIEVIAAVTILDDRSESRSYDGGTGINTTSPIGFRSGNTSSIAGFGSVDADYDFQTSDETLWWSTMMVDFSLTRSQQVSVSTDGTVYLAADFEGGPSSTQMPAFGGEQLILAPGSYTLDVDPFRRDSFGGVGVSYSWYWSLDIEFEDYQPQDSVFAYDVIVAGWQDENANGIADLGEFDQIVGLGAGAGSANSYSNGQILGGLFDSQFVFGSYFAEVFLPANFDINDPGQFIGDASSVIDNRTVVPVPAAGYLFAFSGLMMAFLKRRVR